MSIFCPTRYNALLDCPSGAILTLSPIVGDLVILGKSMPDTRISEYINFPNYISFWSNIFFENLFKINDYPQWSWDNEKRKLIKTKRHVLTKKLLTKSLLAESKRKYISNIILYLNIARRDLFSGIDFQDFVYSTKKEQAQTFKDSGYNEDLIMQCPYVMQYADFANISLKQAAEDIIIKAKFDDDILYKTELLRLKYFDKIKKATTPEQLPSIFEEFIRDCFVNAQI